MPKDISKSTPKTVLDKIVLAVINLSQAGGSSRQAISKALADYGAPNPAGVRARALCGDRRAHVHIPLLSRPLFVAPSSALAPRIRAHIVSPLSVLPVGAECGCARMCACMDALRGL
jgi:hypothetical protein